MTITTEDRIAGPFSSGTVLPFTFKVFAASDLRVVKTLADGTILPDLVSPTDYGVTLNPDQDVSAGGSVTLTSAITGGDSVVVTSELPYLQQVVVTNGGGFFPAVFNGVFDRLTIFAQQLNSRLKGAIAYPVSDGSSVDGTLPPRALRANKFFAFNSSGDPLMADSITGTALSTFGATLGQAADASAGRAVLGATATGGALFTAADAAAARGALSLGTLSTANSVGLDTAAVVGELPTAKIANDAVTTAKIGVSSDMKAFLGAADDAAARSELGITDGIGVGQTYTAYTVGSTRLYATDYTNSTSKPILVIWSSSNIQSCTITFLVGGATINSIAGGASVNAFSYSFIVPPGSTYRINQTGSPSSPAWVELA